MKTTIQKRKTYSLSPEASTILAQTALDISGILKQNVSRQSILDLLVLNVNKKQVLTLLNKQNKKNERA